jgi:hypothetical protein
MTPFVTAGAGFLLAVLWFDLMFDVQARTGDHGRIGSIASYYRRVTLEARPMNLLVALAMAWTLVSLAVQIAEGDAPRGASVASLVLALAAVGLALGHTFRTGARLGSQRDTPAEQAALARLMLRDHLLCLAAIVTVLVLQLAFAR